MDDFFIILCDTSSSAPALSSFCCCTSYVHPLIIFTQSLRVFLHLFNLPGSPQLIRVYILTPELHRVKNLSFRKCMNSKSLFAVALGSNSKCFYMLCARSVNTQDRHQNKTCILSFCFQLFVSPMIRIEQTLISSQVRSCGKSSRLFLTCPVIFSVASLMRK